MQDGSKKHRAPEEMEGLARVTIDPKQIEGVLGFGSLLARQLIGEAGFQTTEGIQATMLALPSNPLAILRRGGQYLIISAREQQGAEETEVEELEFRIGNDVGPLEEYRLHMTGGNAGIMSIGARSFNANRVPTIRLSRADVSQIVAREITTVTLLV